MVPISFRFISSGSLSLLLLTPWLSFLGASSLYLCANGGLWGTVAALCVPIRKTPSGISFPMPPSSAITSVSVSAGSPEPVPPLQTEGRREQAERCSLAELLFQLPRRAQPRPVSPAPACLSPSLRAGVWSCFGNRCHSGLTSRGFVVSLSPS